MRELELQEFIDEIYTDSMKNRDTQYIFFLGAGCSKSSGIPLASALARRWYEELKEQKTKFDKFNKTYKLPHSTKIDFAKYYFEIFEALFPSPLMQQKEIQRVTNDRSVNPSLGYYVLAALMQQTSFNTIITTNFDNLIQDALIYRGHKRALVITHQDLAQFIKRDETPLIVKVHGDAHIHPFNNSDDTKRIPQPLKGAIQSLFTNAKVVFMGYRGDDESISDLLEGCNRIDQVYWLNTSVPKDVKLSQWWKNLSTKTFINDVDFDKIMNVLKSKFTIESPDFYKRAKELENSYNCAIEEEKNELENIKEDQKTDLDYFLLGNLYFQQTDYEEAIVNYQKVIALNPEYEAAYYNMGIAYAKQEEYGQAIVNYQKSIALNPQDDDAYYNMGIAYAKQEEYGQAIVNYQKAIELNPQHKNCYINLFELELIQDKSINIELEKQYRLLFKEHKDTFCEYELLKVFFNIADKKAIDGEIDQWFQLYKIDCLNSWSFEELEKWANSKTGEMKRSLLATIDIFKNRYKIKYDNHT
ncbi:MAG: tetratricopeptide repeat protein [Epsilonproteobacteria bacterium]|nr:tetratricopeptide repeat protein [Campylobacterota bacterium]